MYGAYDNENGWFVYDIYSITDGDNKPKKGNGSLAVSVHIKQYDSLSRKIPIVLVFFIQISFSCQKMDEGVKISKNNILQNVQEIDYLHN